MAEEWLGPYRLVSLLGRGGMGEVWRAVDTHKNREIALKVLRPELGGDQDFIRRFHREAALAGKLQNPHIVAIHNYGTIAGRLFIEMPLIVGTDLGTIVERDGPLPPERAVRIIGQVANALHVAHGARLVHRDVTPRNILVADVGGEDFAYLIDFGIARATDGTRFTRLGDMIGSPPYMAPERFEGRTRRLGALGSGTSEDHRHTPGRVVTCRGCDARRCSHPSARVASTCSP